MRPRVGGPRSSQSVAGAGISSALRTRQTLCDVGQRVYVNQANDGSGQTVHVNQAGIVIGHLGMKWAIVSLDEAVDTGHRRTVLVPEGTARPIRGTQARAVVVRPSGAASALSRKDTQRVRVRKTK